MKQIICLTNKHAYQNILKILLKKNEYIMYKLKNLLKHKN